MRQYNNHWTKMLILTFALVVALTGCKQAGEDDLTTDEPSADLSQSESLESTESESSKGSNETPSPSTPEKSVSSESSPSSSSATTAPSANQNSQTSSAVESEASQLAKTYQQSYERAVATEEHLRATLSNNDYGGIHIWQQDTVTIDVWVINQDKVNAVIQSFPGTPYPVNMKTGRCSLAAMGNLDSALRGIVLNDGESLEVYISEIDNALAVNISKTGEERLRSEISSLVQASQIPSECVVIFVIDPAGENPVT